MAQIKTEKNNIFNIQGCHYKLEKKDFGTLIDHLMSSRKLQTQAMRHGIENESTAVMEYSTHKNVNVKLCGLFS